MGREISIIGPWYKNKINHFFGQKIAKMQHNIFKWNILLEFFCGKYHLKVIFFLGGCHHIYVYWLFKNFLKIMLLVKLKFV